MEVEGWKEESKSKKRLGGMDREDRRRKKTRRTVMELRARG